MAILNSATVGGQINLAGDPHLRSGGKKFTLVMQLSIALFTVSLVWFSFVYYPKAVDKFQKVGLPQGKVVVEAEASAGFPIENGQFRIVYEREPNVYYAFIEGENIAEYADNKNSATLSIKSALGLTTVCELNIVYVSAAELEVPQDLKSPANCK